MQTNDKPIIELMAGIKAGKIQLPDVQRAWVWEDNINPVLTNIYFVWYLLIFQRKFSRHRLGGRTCRRIYSISDFYMS